MKTVILGGSFNPPHLGHLFLAEQALIQGGYDQVLLIPAHIPAHKDDVPMAAPQDRLAMVERAVEGLPAWSAEDCEIRRGGVSYTIDTLRYLKEKGRITGRAGIILGDDLAAGFSSWKEADTLALEADLILAQRGGSMEFPYPHRRLKNRPLPLSSSEIRDRIDRGQAWKWLVARGTAEWIEERGLYRSGRGEA